MGSLVGQHGSQHPPGLEDHRRHGAVVVFIDEIDKGLSGVASSGQTDSGVTPGCSATFLVVAQRPRVGHLRDCYL